MYMYACIMYKSYLRFKCDTSYFIFSILIYFRFNLTILIWLKKKVKQFNIKYCK